MTAAPSVREAAYAFLPWAALTPVAGVACFQLDGIFIGATRTADMRNMMILSLAVFLAAWAVLTPAFGNHGLWASLMAFYAARAASLGFATPRLNAISSILIFRGRCACLTLSSPTYRLPSPQAMQAAFRLFLSPPRVHL